MKVISNKGRVVDFNALRSANATMVAVGNAKMNARGDIVGDNGRIIKTAEQHAADYYASNPRAVTNYQSLSDVADEIFTAAELVQKIDAQQAALVTPVAEVETPAPKPRRKTSDE